jgi:hypothetical protein
MNTQDSTETPRKPKPEDGAAPAGMRFEIPSCEARSEVTGTAIAAAGLAISSVLASCRKEQNVMFELEPVTLYSSAAEKDREKSIAQFISILYTNLFQQALSSNQVFELTQCIESIGDKELAREVIISNFFNAPGVQMPSADEMLSDLNAFIDDTYKRFLIRMPNEAERTWMRNFIQNNPFMTPELVYFAFALSNEYLYY